MGEHNHNPRAIAAANGAFKVVPVEEALGFSFETVLELNKEKLAEVVALIDAAKANGHDPRRAAPAYNPKDNPEFFDYVVYNRPLVGRPSPLLPDPTKVPTARVRYSEHLRIPLVELRQRADELFEGPPDGVQH